MLSIIVPVYNVEKYLEKCVNSILNQKYADIEIVLVDDGSSDGSGRICDDFAAKDHRVSVFHKQNGGLPSAWLFGVKHSNGEYIGFVDSDDYCDPDYYESLMLALKDTDCDIAIGGYTRDYGTHCKFYETGSSLIKPGIYRGEQLATIKSLIFEKPGTLFWARWLRVIKRDLVINNLVYVDERLKVGEDMGITISTFADAQSVVFAKNTGYHYIQRTSSMMHTVTQSEINNFIYLCANLSRISSEKGIGSCNCEIITQILVLIKKIAYCDLKKQEKCILLKQIRDIEIVNKVLEEKDVSDRRFIWKYIIKKFKTLKFLRVLACMKLLKPIIE